MNVRQREKRLDFDRFRRLLQRMERSGVATLSQLVGCSAQEVKELEVRYGVGLPETYTAYLRTMGHNSGRLFKCDHMAVFYHNVLAMTAEQRQTWVFCNAEDGSGPPSEFELPADALLIASRLGQQFEFIHCRDKLDSPVWYFSTWDWKVKESHPSVLEWLECWCGECEQAIADRYFDLYPEGTTP